MQLINTYTMNYSAANLYEKSLIHQSLSDKVLSPESDADHAKYLEGIKCFLIH